MYLHQELTHKIIAAAIEVHKNLGPGLLETVYLKAPRSYELKGNNFLNAREGS